ncbi:helix-turn-helix domain-containing protein [Balneolales bacterium ANBcel1]|nr:helix-turn-helix domain-containing protein [Balneolales bacterium ANBcel1]
MSSKKSHFDAIILDRLKQALNLQTDSQLADYLEVRPTVIANWRRRDRVNTSSILSKCESLNVHWILYGTGYNRYKSSIGRSYADPEEIVEKRRSKGISVQDTMDQLEDEKNKLEAENRHLNSKLEALENLLMRFREKNND